MEIIEHGYQLDCAIDYEDYLEAYEDYADECREKSIGLKNAQAKKNH